MLRNYFLTALRHLKRQPGYTALNILGLTLGVTSSLLILLYLAFETGFDTHHVHADQVYRISSRISEPDDAFNWAVTQMPLGKTVKETFAEVDQYVRFIGSGRTRFRKGEQSYQIEDVYLVDSTVFEVFTYEFIAGDPQTALAAPNSIVLSESEAQKIFKGANPMGEILETDSRSYEITGIFRDQPATTHIVARALCSASSAQGFYNSQNWGGFNIFTYVKLNPGTDPQVVEDKLNKEIMDRYVRVIFDQFDVSVVYELLNIKDIHLYSDFEGEPVSTGSIEYIYIFTAVGLFIVLIACINYMNLATARSTRRSLEVGIRKVMGAHRPTLIRQFIVESVLISFISFLLSIILLLIAVPLINNSLGLTLDIYQLVSVKVLLAIASILIITGFLSGSYPALYLSGYSPIQAIRGGAGSKGGNKWLRRGLVGLQFAISIFMLISTLVIYDQMQYVQSKDLGFDKEQVVFFLMRGNSSEKWPVLRNRLLENPNIVEAGTATTIPGNGYSKNLIPVETKEGPMSNYGVNLFNVDFEYFSSLGVDIVQGRDFSMEFSTDTATAVIVNEAMVRRLGWEDAIGKKFQIARDSTVFHRVIGVAKDFHHLSLYDPIEPLLFVPNLGQSLGPGKSFK